MAFKDIDVVLYDGKIRVRYNDKAHRYYIHPRMTMELPETDEKAWGKGTLTRGVTTVLDSTLEKKGLQTWPMNMALGELFGFYDFKNSAGQQLTGYSRTNKGSIMAFDDDGNATGLAPHTAEALMPKIISASKNHQRRKKKGADIGSIVHDAIEHYVKGQPFEITLAEYEKGQLWYDLLHPVEGQVDDLDDVIEARKEKAEWLKEAKGDVECAIKAFHQFKVWWLEKKPKLLGAEDLVYSREGDYCGTFDGLIELDGKIILCDWKTSKASTSREAASPQGVYYSYFIQSAAYVKAWHEMGRQKIDDIGIISVRKDGGFDVLLASDPLIDLTVEDCVTAWEATLSMYKFITATKKRLLASGDAKAKAMKGTKK